MAGNGWRRWPVGVISILSLTVVLVFAEGAPREATKKRGDDANGDDDVATTDITNAAASFFRDLRTSDRKIARQLLTEKAQSFAQGKNSPLTQLPTPAHGSSSIRPGEVQVDGTVAEIPVRVRAGGQLHNTTLHFRREADEWRVFAVSGKYSVGEMTINFEAEGGGLELADPLQALVGQRLDLTGYSLDGSEVDLADYQGKIVLVTFWATWCGPCRKEIPNILESYEKHHDEGFDVIAVSIDQDMERLHAFVAQNDLPWTVVADNHPKNRRSMGAKYGIHSIPKLLLVAKDGKVVTVDCRGPLLERKIGRLISET